MGYRFCDWVIWDRRLGIGLWDTGFGIGFWDIGFGIGLLGYRLWIWVNIPGFQLIYGPYSPFMDFLPKTYGPYDPYMDLLPEICEPHGPYMIFLTEIIDRPVHI